MNYFGKTLLITFLLVFSCTFINPHSAIAAPTQAEIDAANAAGDAAQAAADRANAAATEPATGGTSAGAVGTVAASAAAGALVGSVVPVVGTAAGAGIGAVVGAGSVVYDKAAGAVANAVNKGIQEVLFLFVSNVFGFFVWVAGTMLNFAIDTFVIGFGGTFKNSGIGVAVNNMWVIIRDFVNLGFIFGLVYIGFKMILGTDTSNTRRWLVNLIIAALLVNFSLFATKFVIDFSNQMATEIAVAGLGANDKDGDGKYESNISQQFFAKMGIPTIVSRIPKNQGYGYIMGMAVLLLVTTFVFAAGAILLIIRFAALNLFLVLSPLMFIGWVLPFMGDQMNKYWKNFLGKCFFAPLYFLMMYFALTVLDGLQRTTGTSGTAGASGSTDFAHPNYAFMAAEKIDLANTDPSVLSTLPFFALVCTFMIMSLVVAQRLGADGAGKAIAYGKRARDKGLNYTKRSGKFVAAQTGGRAARYGANQAGQGLDRGLRRLQQSDSKLVRSIARSNAVQGTVGGGVKSLKNSKFGLSRTIEEDKKMLNQTNKSADNSMAITAGLAAQREQNNLPPGMASVVRNGVSVVVPITSLSATERATYDQENKAREDKIALMERKVTDMGIKDFEAMTKDEQLRVAEFLSGPLSESVLKSDNVSDEQKAKITAKQQDAIKKTLTENGTLLTGKITDLSIRQIETLGDQFITDNAAFFSDSQFADIKKSKKIKILYSSSCDSVGVDEVGRVTVSISNDHDTSNIKKMSPDLILGCDGINSIVRTWLASSDSNADNFTPVSLPSDAAGLRYKMLTLKNRCEGAADVV